MKTKVCNQLNTHLDLRVKMFGHNFFDIGNHLVSWSYCNLEKKKLVENNWGLGI
jgi:hypothetical protein